MACAIMVKHCKHSSCFHMRFNINKMYTHMYMDVRFSWVDIIAAGLCGDNTPGQVNRRIAKVKLWLGRLDLAVAYSPKTRRTQRGQLLPLYQPTNQPTTYGKINRPFPSKKDTYVCTCLEKKQNQKSKTRVFGRPPLACSRHWGPPGPGPARPARAAAPPR